MTEWWASLSILQQGLYCVALPATLILLLQTILLIFGWGDDADVGVDASDAELPDDGLRIFSVRGLVGFLTVGAWAGLACLGNGLSPFIAIAAALLLGFLAMYLLAKMVHAVLKLQESGNVKMTNAIGGMGKVYLSIPEDQKGTGKISILVQDQLREYDAVTLGKALPTGTVVRVIGMETGGVLIVDRDEPERLLGE
ncbi:MAG: hypothetical protein LBM75_06215 [Myxococcales bacterium]|jgi:membrane protein implicated in regulation of membrane protease activity|nr:hypothetical protein [Myxococcales bacterium]